MAPQTAYPCGAQHLDRAGHRFTRHPDATVSGQGEGINSHPTGAFYGTRLTGAQLACTSRHYLAAVWSSAPVRIRRFHRPSDVCFAHEKSSGLSPHRACGGVSPTYRWHAALRRAHSGSPSTLASEAKIRTRWTHGGTGGLATDVPTRLPLRAPTPTCLISLQACLIRPGAAFPPLHALNRTTETGSKVGSPACHDLQPWAFAPAWATWPRLSPEPRAFRLAGRCPRSFLTVA